MTSKDNSSPDIKPSNSGGGNLYGQTEPSPDNGTKLESTNIPTYTPLSWLDKRKKLKDILLVIFIFAVLIAIFLIGITKLNNVDIPKQYCADLKGDWTYYELKNKTGNYCDFENGSSLSETQIWRLRNK